MRLFQKKTRNELIDNKANAVLQALRNDLSDFSHTEEVNILLMVLNRFKADKKEKRQELTNERDEINNALESLK